MPYNPYNSVYSWKPLHIAAANNQKEIAELLIEYGADIEVVNYSSETPLHIAARFNSKEVAELLIEKGANLNAEDFGCSCHYYGSTPLHFAAMSGSKEVAEFVKKSHEDWKKTPGKRGQQHQETPVRVFKITDDIKENNWEAIENSLKVNS